MYNRQQNRVKTVTIAIPSLHRPDLTARCLQFIQQQTLPADQWEVVVIENEARSNAILPDPLPPTPRIELSANGGTTGSINRAIAMTQSRYVMLLNNDVELDLAAWESGKRARCGRKSCFCHWQVAARNAANSSRRCGGCRLLAAPRTGWVISTLMTVNTIAQGWCLAAVARPCSIVVKSSTLRPSG